MRVHVANITSFGKHTLDWLWSRDNELHVLVETHLDRQKHSSMCQYLEVCGRRAFGYPLRIPTAPMMATMVASLCSTTQPMASPKLSTMTRKEADTRPFCGKPKHGPFWWWRSLQDKRNHSRTHKLTAASTHPCAPAGLQHDNSFWLVTGTTIQSSFKVQS